MLPDIHRATQKFYIFLIVYLTGCTPVDVSFATQIRIPYLTCLALGYIRSILVSGNLVSNIFVMAVSGVFALWCLS